MNGNKPVHVNKWLLPFSWVYGFIVFFRNKFFSWGIFKQEEFDIPVICVGNITAGGTGKTPHTEYIVGVLKDKYRVAVLSRGYGRKKKGYILADKDSTSLEIGDEPFQIKQKYPEIMVAVDGKRRRGIRNLLDLQTPPEVIILDDAFQHRYVRPSYSVVLSNYNRPIYEDTLLPAGRLRESMSHLKKANIVVVTKCPKDMKPIDYRIISHDLNMYPYQDLYFSTFEYKNLKSIFYHNDEMELDELKGRDILLVTGIASPSAILKELAKYTDKVETITYPDHYTFKKKDIKKIKKKFDSIQSDNKIIVVTEKDATRMVSNKILMEDEIRGKIYSLPIEVVFVDSEGEKFDEKIIRHVKEYSRNRIVYTK